MEKGRPITPTKGCNRIDTYEVLAACHNRQFEVRIVDLDAVVAVVAVRELSVICFTPTDKVILQEKS